jgi:dCMP deaminase
VRAVPSWDAYFLGIAHSVAVRSKDPSTQVGAVICRGRDIVAVGYNGFPPGLAETPTLWERPAKYDLVIHAEENAILRAARSGVSIVDSCLYVTLPPCQKCARLIVAAGIKRVIFDSDRWEHYSETLTGLHGFNTASKILSDCGVLIEGAESCL